MTMFSHWEQNELSSGVKPPPSTSFRWRKAGTAGVAWSMAGKPIVGARVQVSSHDIKPAGSDGRTS